MIRLIILLLAFMLSACTTVKGQFENRVSCTLGGQRLMTTSFYGPFGLTSKIAPEDGDVVCKKPAAAPQGRM